MANTYYTTTGDGVTDTYAFAFDYISRDYVHAYVDGVEDLTFTWVTSSSIQLSSVPAVDAVIVIQRETPRDALITSIPSSGTLRGADINNQSEQVLDIAAEAYDALNDAIRLNLVTNVFDAGNKRITNVATPTASGDATNKSYVDTAVATVASAYAVLAGIGYTANYFMVGDGSAWTAKSPAQARTAMSAQRFLCVNVLDYGATGDGTTDDTAAIQAALNAGYWVHFPTPSVNYKVTAALNVTGSKRITGDNCSSTTIASTHAGALFYANNVSTYGLTIENLQLSGPGSAGSIGFYVASTAEETAHIAVRDVRFYNFDYGTSGGSTYAAFDSLWENCDFIQCVTVGASVLGSQNTFVGCFFRSCGWGVDLGNAGAPSIGGAAFLGCTWVSNTYDVVVTTPTVRSTSFVNCWMEQASSAIIGTTEGGEVTFLPMTFKGCTFQPGATCTGNGILVGFSSMAGTVNFDDCVAYYDLYASTAFPNGSGEDANAQVRNTNCVRISGATIAKVQNVYGSSLFHEHGSAPIISTARLDAHGAAATVGTLDFYGLDSGSNSTHYASIYGLASDHTDTSEDGALVFGVMTGGSFADELVVYGAGIYPVTNDGLSLGVSGNAFSDVFLATGAVIDLGAGDITLTHSSNILDLAGGTFRLSDLANGPLRVDANGDVAVGNWIADVSNPYATTSGTSVAVTGVPSWATEIRIVFDGVSQNAADGIYIQVGDSGGIETTGYVAAYQSGAGVGGSGAAFYITDSTVTAAMSVSGEVFLRKTPVANQWSLQGHMVNDTGSLSFVSHGLKATSATLDRFTIFSATASTFDAGSFYVEYR